MSSDKVAAFAGTLAEFYDRYLVPLNFAPYAEVVADRTKALFPRRVLEMAAAHDVSILMRDVDRSCGLRATGEPARATSPAQPAATPSANSLSPFQV